MPPSKGQLAGCRACVVVLGDIGRSPRMQFHALSLLAAGAELSVVAYAGEDLVPSLQAQSGTVHLALFSPLEWPALKRRCWPLFALVKAAALVLQLAWALLTLRRPDFILVQNPPALPVLPIVWAYGALRGVPVVVDWHNLGYTVLALALGLKDPARRAGSRVVRLCKAAEAWCAARAAGHLCVTHAMRGFLASTFAVEATPLHDCPPAFFGAYLTAADKHDLFTRLKPDFAHAEELLAAAVSTGDTLFTRVDPTTGHASERPDRPALVLSSTSWTEDEDFDILLDALVALDGDEALPPCVVAVTGKGPLKSHYVAKVAALAASGRLTRFRVVTLWLAPADYPKLLRCADLGICLHTSTSGLDLPMKVVDFFGSGLPVVAVAFDCLGELVKHGVNGVVFEDAPALAVRLKGLLAGFPHRCDALAALRKGVQATVRWEENWVACGLPLLLRVAAEGKQARRRQWVAMGLGATGALLLAAVVAWRATETRRAEVGL